MVKVYRVSLEEQSLAEWERHWYEILENKASEYGEPLSDAEIENAVGRSTIETLLQASGFISYLDRTHRSNVKEYRKGGSYIVIRFKDESTYLYSTAFLSGAELDYIKDLADSGSGLNSYLTRLIGRRFTARLYKDVVFIQPGLEAYSHHVLISNLALESLAEAPMIAEKRFIKNLIEILQHNQQLRLKRVTEALGTSLDNPYSFNIETTLKPLNLKDPAVRVMINSDSETVQNSLKLMTYFNDSVIGVIRRHNRNRLLESFRFELEQLTGLKFCGGFTFDSNLDWITLNTSNETIVAFTKLEPQPVKNLLGLLSNSSELTDRLVGVMRKAMFEINEHNSGVLIPDLKTFVTTVDSVNNYLVDLLIVMACGIE